MQIVFEDIDRSLDLDAGILDGGFRRNQVLSRLVDLEGGGGLELEQRLHATVVALRESRCRFETLQFRHSRAVFGALFAHFVRVIPREHLILSYRVAEIDEDGSDEALHSHSHTPRAIISTRDPARHTQQGGRVGGLDPLRLDLARRLFGRGQHNLVFGRFGPGRQCAVGDGRAKRRHLHG